MLPIRDTIRSRNKPIVNWCIIVTNVLVFTFEASLPPDGLNRLIHLFGLTPTFFVRNPIFESLTIFTSMFLHGGWFHLISNMWMLWIFGDNIEDRMGHFRYLGFYLLCGIAAGLAQVFIATHSSVPMVGASGAIAGISGAYLLLFPRARIVTLVPIFFFFTFLEIPALIYLGFWFLTQLFSGLSVLAVGGRFASHGGVAWWAHIGGFGAGLILVKLFARKRLYRDEYRPW